MRNIHINIAHKLGRINIKELLTDNPDAFIKFPTNVKLMTAHICVYLIKIKKRRSFFVFVFLKIFYNFEDNGRTWFINFQPQFCSRLNDSYENLPD